MLTEPQPSSTWPTRKILLWTSLPLAAVLIYLGWIFYSRAKQNRELDEKARALQAAKTNAENRKTVELLGGNRFEIMSFYANPRAIRRGDTAQLCYGVSNAKAVKLDPPEGPVWPAYSRCFEVAPKKKTTYTLTATDASGNVLTQTLTLNVQ